jgi:hypothetical protein
VLPRRLSPEARRVALLEVATDYLMAHPGAACKSEDGFTCTDDFRRFIVGLTGPGQPAEKMSLAELATVTRIPHDLLREWLAQR